MRWFGESWLAPVCEEGEHVATPVGEVCQPCGKTIRDGDRGLVLVHYGGEQAVSDYPVHLACLIASVVS